MIYLNEYEGNSTFAKLLHKHAVEHAASQSVRNRIKLIPHMIEEYFSKSRSTQLERIDILSVGSGAAFELKDIYKSSKDCTRYNFVLYDQDPIALGEAAAIVQQPHVAAVVIAGEDLSFVVAVGFTGQH